ncbi:MAG: AzlC family ABC transporter permease [Clostridia bacterium]|nr:AzlC family ABC transporter permease [Clostridia bacterium]
MFWQGFVQGSKTAIPIVLGYFPLGLAFGVLAKDAGLNVWETLIMSFMVFAGAGQFIAVGLLKAGATFVTIVATTFLVNLRLFLMGMALQPKIKNWSKLRLGIIAAEITDETFVVASDHYSDHEPSWPFHLGLNVTSHMAWVISSGLGASVGNLIQDPARFGLNFALPAMFIALLVGQIKNHTTLIVAVAAGIISLWARTVIPGNWHILLATVVAASLGVVIAKWMGK